jgi:hypothetical protein
MAAKKSAASSYAAAFVLVALTLFVFYTFRDYGPASAVRRFHDDIKNNNPDDLQRVTVGPLYTRNFIDIARQLASFDAHEARPRVAATQMISSDEASVITVFQLPDQESYFLVFIVRKEPNGPWQVDPNLTVSVNQSSNKRRPVGI